MAFRFSRIAQFRAKNRGTRDTVRWSGKAENRKCEVKVLFRESRARLEAVCNNDLAQRLLEHPRLIFYD